jgi:hypothetical protein
MKCRLARRLLDDFRLTIWVMWTIFAWFRSTGLNTCTGRSSMKIEFLARKITKESERNPLRNFCGSFFFKHFNNHNVPKIHSAILYFTFWEIAKPKVREMEMHRFMPIKLVYNREYHMYYPYKTPLGNSSMSDHLDYFAQTAFWST